jgi:hypothetical protein
VDKGIGCDPELATIVPNQKGVFFYSLKAKTTRLYFDLYKGNTFFLGGVLVY